MGCAPHKPPYKLIRVIWLTIRFLSMQPKHSIYHTVQATVQATVQVTAQAILDVPRLRLSMMTGWGAKRTERELLEL